MRKLVLQMNMSLDGYADHTVAVADDELHDFARRQLDNVDLLLFGRATYELMEFWHGIRDFPDATESMISFAEKFNATPKIVFSRTLRAVNRKNETLIRENTAEYIKSLKELSGGNIAVTGISFSRELMRLGLIDEYLFLVQPLFAGKGRRLFEDAGDAQRLRLVESETFKSGVIVSRYSSGA